MEKLRFAAAVTMLAGAFALAFVLAPFGIDLFAEERV